jgi:serine/threonine protein kinase
MPEKGISGARLTKLGRYEVLSELGKGAMGVVYLAKDPVIGRMVAIKTIRMTNVGDDDSESREFRERFIREAQTAGILSHPNIVTIHDIGEDPETQTSFIAMEYIEGKNLKSLLAEKAPFSYDQIADMIAQVAEAIDYAHRKGIIHRDIKPANIIITTDEKVKITDFGIAKVASSNLTTTGQFLGTPNYMSPEQVSGAPVDGRSDIFSLGVVLYELLTKRKPFQGENLTAISYKIVHEDFTPPAELSRDVPPEFNPIVARAMAKDPWNRYQRGKDLALALHQLRAHLEEQKALQDLGTIVSEAEFMPTLRLANLEQLAEAGAPPGRSTQVTPPDDRATEVLSTDDFPSSEPFAPTGTYNVESRDTDTNPSLGIDLPPPTIPPPPIPGDIPVATAPPDLRTNVIPRDEFPPVISSTPPPPPPPPPRTSTATAAPLPPPRPAVPRAEPAAKRTIPALDALKKQAAMLAAKDWGKLLKAEINSRWFLAVAAGVFLFWVVALSPLFIYSLVVARPKEAADTTLEKETKEKRQSIAEAQKLFAAGQYDRSLALCRAVLARSPNNQLARRYAQMSENALTGRKQEADKAAAAEQKMQAAQAAFAAGNYDEAKRQADDVLALDGGRVEAQKLRTDAATKIAEAEAAAAAARKKAAKPAPVAKRAPPPTAVAVAQKQAPAPTAAAPVATGPTTLRLVFDSPISEGNIMVAVNEKIVLRQPFDFRKKEGLFKKVSGTGTVDVALPMQPGPLSVKAWLSGPDIPASLLAQTSAQIATGETKVLRLDYSNGRLSARVQ